MPSRLFLLACLLCLALGAGIGMRLEPKQAAAPAPAASPGWQRHFSAATFPTEHPVPVASDARCTEDRAAKQTVVVYAWPSDVGDRSARYAGSLRRAALGASAALTDSARRHGGQGARIVFRCTGGAVDVLSVRLSTTSTTMTYESIEADLRAALEPLGAYGANIRRVVFLDWDSRSSVGGFAWTPASTLPEGQAKPPAANAYDSGEPYVVLYNNRRLGASWPVFLHEWLHSMGAVGRFGLVGNGPPNGASGHCFDGADVMCYADGATRGGRTYTATRCAIVIVDCGGDDYFDPTPAAGSWPATHWNLGTDATGWIDYAHPGAAPSARPTIAVRPISSQAVRMTWTAVAGAASYRVWCISSNAGAHGSAWLPKRRVTGRATVFEGIRHGAVPQCRVHGEGAQGAAGPSSAASPRFVRMPQVRPVRNTRVVGRTSRTLTIAWDRSPQLHIRRYEIWTGAYISQVVRRGSTTGTRFTIRNLRPGRSYPVRVVAFDKAGNFGYGPIINARTR